MAERKCHQDVLQPVPICTLLQHVLMTLFIKPLEQILHALAHMVLLPSICNLRLLCLNHCIPTCMHAINSFRLYLLYCCICVGDW